MSPQCKVYNGFCQVAIGLAASAFFVAGSIVSPAWAACPPAPSCGAPLAQYRNVVAYSNGPDQCTANSCAGGVKYQCVELADRFARANLGTGVSPIGTAKNIFFNPPAGFVAINNGTAPGPAPNDFIVLDATGSNPSGHVGVTTQVTANSVTTVEQNYSSNGQFTYAMKNYLIAARSGARVLGWVRRVATSATATPIAAPIATSTPRPTATAPATTPTRAATATPTPTSASSSPSWNFVAGMPQLRDGYCDSTIPPSNTIVTNPRVNQVLCFVANLLLTGTGQTITPNGVAMRMTLDYGTVNSWNCNPQVSPSNLVAPGSWQFVCYGGVWSFATTGPHSVWFQVNYVPDPSNFYLGYPESNYNDDAATLTFTVSP